MLAVFQSSNWSARQSSELLRLEQAGPGAVRDSHQQLINASQKDLDPSFAPLRVEEEIEAKQNKASKSQGGYAYLG